MRAYAAAIDGTKAQSTTEIGSHRTLPGTINALIVSYYRSPEFCSLSETTQRVRRNIIESFRADHGDKPLRGLRREHLKIILGSKAAKPDMFNHCLKTLRGLLKYAVDLEWIAVNPTDNIARMTSKSDGHHSWTDEEVAQFQARHPIGTKAGLALALGLYTAQRKGDVIRMGWQHVSQVTIDGVSRDVIDVRQEKTSAALKIFMHPNLKAALAAIPRSHLTFLTTSGGASFAAGYFGNWFRDQCNAAGLPHCSFHGLRKAALTRAAEAGCTTEMLKALGGHKSLRELSKYTRAVDQARLNRQALDMQLRAAIADGECGDACLMDAMAKKVKQ